MLELLTYKTLFFTLPQWSCSHTICHQGKKGFLYLKKGQTIEKKKKKIIALNLAYQTPTAGFPQLLGKMQYKQVAGIQNRTKTTPPNKNLTPFTSKIVKMLIKKLSKTRPVFVL